jgi:hypothetical protein
MGVCLNIVKGKCLSECFVIFFFMYVLFMLKLKRKKEIKEIKCFNLH